MNEEVMQFPSTLDEFIKEYSFTDNKEVYTNGSELIPVFRIKQWENHKQNNWNELKKWIEEDTEVAETNFEMGRCFNMFDLLNKMQELEQGKDE